MKAYLLAFYASYTTNQAHHVIGIDAVDSIDAIDQATAELYLRSGQDPNAMNSIGHAWLKDGDRVVAHWKKSNKQWWRDESNRAPAA